GGPREQRGPWRRQGGEVLHPREGQRDGLLQRQRRRPAAGGRAALLRQPRPLRRRTARQPQLPPRARVAGVLGVLGGIVPLRVAGERLPEGLPLQPGHAHGRLPRAPDPDCNATLQSTTTDPEGVPGGSSGMPGGFLSLSANGSAAGSGILWAFHAWTG